MPRFTRNSRDCGEFASTSGVNGVLHSGEPSLEATTSATTTEQSTVSTSTVVGVNQLNGHPTATSLVDDVVQALQGRIGGLIDSAIDARLSLLSGNANSAHPLVQSSTGGSAEPVVDDLHRRAGNLATLGLQQPLTAVEPGVVGASTGMPRMVNCLPNTRGRLVPSFVDTFSAPSTSVVWSSDSIGSTLEPGFTSLPSTLPSSLDTVAHPLGIGLASLPLPGNVLSPFIVGPGYAPVPAKTVNAIVTGKFINLGDLLPDNALALDEVTEPQLLLDGRLVLTGAARKPRKEIRDILSWVEAFTVFSVILGSHSPHRSRFGLVQVAHLADVSSVFGLGVV